MIAPTFYLEVDNFFAYLYCFTYLYPFAFVNFCDYIRE